MKRVIMATLVLAGCATVEKFPLPEQADATITRPGVTAESLRRGRELTLLHCGGCHRLYPPEHARRQQWPAILARMGRLFDLPEDEARFIEEYLVTFAKP
jgi:hypothetical protein